MKKTAIKEMRTKTKEELDKVLEDKKKELSRLIIDKWGRKLKNVAKIGSIRQEIAIILTIISQKELVNK